MTEKTVECNCSSCESSYHIIYTEEMVSQELPEHCAFCGEIIDEITEEYIEDDDSEDDEEWN